MKISSAQYAKTLVALSGEERDVSRVAKSFLSFVRKRRGTRKLDEIVRVAERLADEKVGCVSLLAETAVSADDTMRREIEVAAREAFPGKEVVVSYVVRPELLGGVRLSSDSEVADGTLRRRLSEMAKGIMKAE